ncbi:MAG: Flp family type IVb pilin [Gemmatimonadaceae bacterium]
MTRIVTAVRKFTGNEEGAALVEYGILVAFIAVVAIAAVTLLGGNIAAKFDEIAAALT